MIQIFNNHFETMDKVLDIVETIGTELPHFQRTQNPFSSDKMFLRYHPLFYKEITDFHLALIKLSRHSGT